MASRHFDAVNALTKRLVLIAGQFQCNGTGAPTVLSGSGFTVTRTGTGAYTVLLNDNYNAVSYVQAQLVQATPADVVNVTSSVNTSATPGATFTLKIGAVATPNTGADLTQTGGDCVSFLAALRNSSIVS
jgi:hypothetical protein